jgi:AIR synthase-related protein
VTTGLAAADLAILARTLRDADAFGGKRRISAAAGVFASLARDFGIRNGDDAAVIPQGDGFLLLAAEGIVTELVRSRPRLAGACAVVANVNDIYAMGGRPLAMVDVVGAPGDDEVLEMCRGMRACAERYRVPVVGGHLLRTQGDVSLAVAILGKAKRCITSFDARPGDRLLLVRRRRGRPVEGFGFWNCTLPEDDGALPGDLELLPACAEAELVSAGKDVSMGGVAGTAVMLAESSRIGLRIDLDALDVPEGYTMDRWLLAFLSYGFLLAVDPGKLPRVVDVFEGRGVSAVPIGEFLGEPVVWLESRGVREPLWDLGREPFAGGGS